MLCSEDGRIVGFAGGAIEPVSFFRCLRKDKGLVFLFVQFQG